MQQLEIFYFIVTLIAGLLSFGFAVFFARGSASPALKHYLYFYGTFSLTVILNFTASYLRANVEGYETITYYLLLYLENPVTLVLLIYLTAAFVHHFLGIENLKEANHFFAVAAILIFIQHNAFLFIDSRFDIPHYIGLLKNVIFVLTIIYCWVLLLRKAFVADEAPDGFIKGLAIAWFFLIPAIINDALFLSQTGVKVFPLLYAVAGVTFTRYFYKQTNNEPGQGSRYVPVTEVPAWFADQYELSERELEVIRLLLQGKSYKQISEEMFISVNTVKTHIRNIYPKLNVSSRHEIAALLGGRAPSSK